jgi:hypothetical protein
MFRKVLSFRLTLVHFNMCTVGSSGDVQTKFYLKTTLETAKNQNILPHEWPELREFSESVQNKVPRLYPENISILHCASKIYALETLLCTTT